jgi:transcriptional regulator with XRE-family HTH domain
MNISKHCDMKKTHIETINKVMGKGNLNQHGLSKLLGVTQGAVNHWLMGRANPSKINMEALNRLQRIFEAKDIAMSRTPFQASPKQPTGNSIAMQAHSIVNERAEEKERQYGDFHTTMRRANDILNSIMNTKLPEQTMYFAMVAMKLAREGHSHKTDNLLDAMAYMQALENLENKQDVSESK